MSKMDLNGDDEKINIEEIFWSAMDMLSDDDKKLPQASCHFFLFDLALLFKHVFVFGLEFRFIVLLLLKYYVRCNLFLCSSVLS